VPSRFLIGIDLGTTNSVVAYIDTEEPAEAGPTIRVFPVPQLVAHGEVRTLPALPSFLYFPTEEELSTGSVSATWDEDPPMVTGVLAREQGALVPTRQVSSAKSWLSNPGVDRRGRILPAQAEPPQPMISPVEASARYLMHLRDAWNGAIGTSENTRFQQQDIVLTVPASFDEEARELTVEAARRAGLDSVTLLEEPLAAFYAWIAANRGKRENLRGDELILICDIGGGTSDFSLLRTHAGDGELQFERTAIGEHLLLGGDNLDLALSRHIEEKLKDVKLTLRQRYALRRACCAAKERLLSDATLERTPVTILGSGRAVVGQTLSVDLDREEVLRTLTTGFLPITAPDDMPARGRPTGFRELGLPYAVDPAITRHLAAFLRQASVTMGGSMVGRSSQALQPISMADVRLSRPDAVLFNGGFCAPAVIRDRILAAISGWFGGAQNNWRPKLLDNDAMDTAVARGAAYYARVRRGAGLRIRAGSARTYYVGLAAEHGLQGLCVLPAGVDEGTTLPLLNREFSVLANRPISFTLYSSRLRHDKHGDIVGLEEASVHRHAPLVTLLRYGKKMRDAHLTVRLRASFTETGTLELWCEARDTPHRWRLQFELRGEQAQAQEAEETPRQVVAAHRPAGSDFDPSMNSAVQLIRGVFSGADDGTSSPENLVAEMETALHLKRDSWAILAVRRFADVLVELADARTQSPRHEVRWLNLAGFCSRPGFGAPDDDKRASHLRGIALNGPVFADNLPSRVETLVLLRRISGGINASAQQAIYRKHAPLVSIGAHRGGRKTSRVNRQLEYETWRLFACLEHLPARTRATLGSELLAKIRKEPEDAIWLWSLGRLGARIPLYGPLQSIVGAEIAGEWLKELLEFPSFTAAAVSAVTLMARRTDDRTRDIDDHVRDLAISRLNALGIAADTLQPLSKYVPPETTDAVRSFGESLPPGLQLVSSSNCLLSVPALQSYSPLLTKHA
jgi:molecular chaperone DnaK (HSP70)